MTTSRQIRRTGTSLGFAAIFLWGTTVAVVRSLTEQVGPLTSASLAYLLGGVAGTTFQLRSRETRARLTSLRPAYLMVCGTLFVVYMACLYLAIGRAQDRTQAIETGLINHLWTVFTLLFSILFLRLRPRPLLLLGLASAAGGMFLAVTHQSTPSPHAFLQNWAGNPLAYFLALGAAISWGLYSSVSRKLGGTGEGGAAPIFMLATGVLLFIFSRFAGETTTWSVRAVGELLYLGLLGNLGYAFWEQAMRKGDIVLVAASSYAIPLLSAFVAALYLRTWPGPRLWIGAVLIIAGAVICKRSVTGSPHE